MGQCALIDDDGVFVGDSVTASNRALLEEVGVTHVVNLIAAMIEPPFPDAFTYLALHLEDVPSESLTPVIFPVVDFIKVAGQRTPRVKMWC